MLIYSAALTLGLVLSTPWWLTRMLTQKRYREGLRERLGRVPRRLRTSRRERRVVWVHAVSVGEVLAASRLVQELDESLGPDGRVVVSTTTKSGQLLARERFGAARVFYFPLDFRWAVRAYLRVLRPALLLLLESELWPRMLHECARGGVPVVVANARVSDRSFRRAQRVQGFWAKLVGRATLWLAQGETDASRLVALGVPSGKVRVSGNLKYDIRAPRESRLPEWIRQAAAGRPVIVAGSTTDDPRGIRDIGEEALVLRAWDGLVRSEGKALLVLAPRHPERFDLIENVLTEFTYARASHWVAADNDRLSLLPGNDGRLEILLLDTIGDLAAVYSVADLAFVGGSLVRRGGHNPLEPAQFGVPVLMGPFFENFRDIVAKLRVAGALRIIEDAEELEAAMLRLLRDPATARTQGEHGRRVFEQEGGATARTLAALLPMLLSEGGDLATRENTTVRRINA